MQLTRNPSDEELIFHISLARITFLKFNEKKKLFKNLDSADSLSVSSIDDISALIGRTVRSSSWNGAENLRLAKRSLARCRTLGIGILLYYDERFPELLRQISDCPYLLYYRGDAGLFMAPSVSVVGSRRITSQGKSAARAFAYEACAASCNVVSGLANGADGCAHQGALDAYYDCLDSGRAVSSLGRTIAVLPGSIDEIVPAGHKKMAVQIVESGGLLLSEYEPGMGIANWHFVARNRIIAALSAATVVVEAPPGSGALITADFAVEMNRDLLFLASAFSEQARRASELVARSLQRELAAGRVSQYKAENTVEKFLRDGAPVIKDYKDYCRCLDERPGERSAQIKQLGLFEDKDGY